MPLFRRETLEEQLAAQIERESEWCKKRCDELHEEFRSRLRSRDEAKAALSAVSEELSELQGRRVSLLGRLNAATRGGDEEKLEELERNYEENLRELARIRRRRDGAARRLAAVELDEEEAARELARTASALLEEHAARAGELKERLRGLMDALDERQEEVAQAAFPLIEEYEIRRPRSGSQDGSQAS